MVLLKEKTVKKVARAVKRVVGGAAKVIWRAWGAVRSWVRWVGDIVSSPWYRIYKVAGFGATLIICGGKVWRIFKAVWAVRKKAITSDCIRGIKVWRLLEASRKAIFICKGGGSKRQCGLTFPGLSIIIIYNRVFTGACKGIQQVIMHELLHVGWYSERTAYSCGCSCYNFRCDGKRGEKEYDPIFGWFYIEPKWCKYWWQMI